MRAQTSMTAFLPELNSHFRLSSNIRLVFDAKGYMEDGDLNRAQVGPSLQFNIRPLEKLKRFRHGRHEVHASGVHHRISLSPIERAARRPPFVSHPLFPGTILLSDRSRGDLDWSNGSFRWTYRNRFICRGWIVTSRNQQVHTRQFLISKKHSSDHTNPRINGSIPDWHL